MKNQKVELNSNQPETVQKDSDIVENIIKEFQITQKQFGEMVGICESTISSIIKGTRKLNRNQIQRIVTNFNISANLFF